MELDLFLGENGTKKIIKWKKTLLFYVWRYKEMLEPILP